MELGKTVKKAMIDADIEGAVGLAEVTGLSKEKCFRLLRGDTTLRLGDVQSALGVLGYELSVSRYQLKAEVKS